MIEILDVKVNQIQIKDEFSSSEMNQMFELHKQVLVKGDFPGVGKSFAGEHFMPKKTLIVTPTNTLGLTKQIETGIKAVTLNRLFGWGKNDQAVNRKKPLNVNDYNCIIFDEIFLYDPH